MTYLVLTSKEHLELSGMMSVLSNYSKLWTLDMNFKNLICEKQQFFAPNKTKCIFSAFRA